MALTGEMVLSTARQFTEGRILLSGAELGLFDALAVRDMDAGGAASELGCAERPLRILLDALAAMGYLCKREGRYAISDDARPLLTSGSATSVLPMVLHAAGMWRRWNRLSDICRGAPSEDHSTATRTPEQLRAFIGAMHVVASPRVPELLGAIDPAGVGRLLDVGGASGTYTIGFLRANPALRATLFDLPPVVEMARERLGSEGLLDRVTLVSGDYNRDEFPGGHDLVLLSAVVHQNSHKENRALYSRSFRALAPGGRVVVRDHIMSPDRLEPRSGALFAVNMLCGTAGGDCYTFEQTRTALEDAGFADVRVLVPDQTMNGIIAATRPA